jgi:hypothetical protein
MLVARMKRLVPTGSADAAIPAWTAIAVLAASAALVAVPLVAYAVMLGIVPSSEVAP